MATIFCRKSIKKGLSLLSSQKNTMAIMIFMACAWTSWLTIPWLLCRTLAKAVLTQSSDRVAAITGSIGKTSTKEFTKTLLSINICVSPHREIAILKLAFLSLFSIIPSDGRNSHFGNGNDRLAKSQA